MISKSSSISCGTKDTARKRWPVLPTATCSDSSATSGGRGKANFEDFTSTISLQIEPRMTRINTDDRLVGKYSIRRMHLIDSDRLNPAHIAPFEPPTHHRLDRLEDVAPVRAKNPCRLFPAQAPRPLGHKPLHWPTQIYSAAQSAPQSPPPISPFPYSPLRKQS